MLALGACLGGARDPAEQIAAGGVVYRARCVRCHEQEGGIGTALHPEVLFAYGTPQRLVDYVKLAMPYDSVGVLEEGEYWDVVAYLLDAAGLKLDRWFTPADQYFSLSLARLRIRARASL